MATTSYPNAIAGRAFATPVTHPGQGVYETSSTQRHRLGTRLALEDGRVYRYCEAGGTALAPGKLCVSPNQTSNHNDIALSEAAAIESRSLKPTLGGTALTVNEYADGYIHIHDAAGEGVMYQVRDHAAADASAVATINIYGHTVEAYTTSTEVSLTHNIYKDAVISVTDQADFPIGVPPVNVTEDYFFWLQTWGMCPVLGDEAFALGDQLTTGTGVAGAVEMLDGAGEPPIGVSFETGVVDEYTMVFLQLNP